MLSRLLCSVTWCLAALIPSAHAANGVLTGKMEGKLYVSPTGEFKVPSPILPELGGSVTDTDNVVVFSDNFNTHISIACFFSR